MASDRIMDRRYWGEDGPRPALPKPINAYTTPKPVAPATPTAPTAPAPTPAPAAPAPVAPTPAAPAAPTQPQAPASPATPVAPTAPPPLAGTSPVTTSPPPQPARPFTPAEKLTANDGGLVGSRAGAPYQAGVSGWSVDGNQLVENRTNNIISKDSELMQRAASRAMQQANDRGLINSSMAIGAGQTAVLDAATDIAKQDANTYAQSAQFNADSSNKASMFNAGQSNQWDTNDLDRKFKKSERIEGQGFTSAENQLDRNFKSGESDLDRKWKTAEAGTDRVWQSGEKKAERDARIDEYKFTAQTNKELKELGFKYEKELNNDSNLDKQYGMYVEALYKIDSNPDLDGPAKQKLKFQQAVAFESYAKIRGLRLDLDFSSQYLPPAGETGPERP